MFQFLIGRIATLPARDDVAFININIKSGYIVGRCVDKKIVEKETGSIVYYVFKEARGKARTFAGEEISLDKNKTYYLVSSGLMRKLLDDKVGMEVCLIYTGKKKVKNYPQPVHQYMMFVKVDNNKLAQVIS